jgi:hypothetical protein
MNLSTGVWGRAYQLSLKGPVTRDFWPSYYLQGKFLLLGMGYKIFVLFSLFFSSLHTICNMWMLFYFSWRGGEDRRER